MIARDLDLHANDRNIPIPQLGPILTCDESTVEIERDRALMIR